MPIWDTDRDAGRYRLYRVGINYDGGDASTSIKTVKLLWNRLTVEF
jgi:hypothetical protein